MKKENCPFCGHRWIRKASELQIRCPNCKETYYARAPQDKINTGDIVKEKKLLTDECETTN
jgi:ribosomal protein L37AE/L43A